MARAKKGEGVQEEVAQEERGGSRVYELGFHIDSELPQEEVKNVYQAVRDHIIARGSLVGEGEPYKLQLAYTLSKDSSSGRRDFNSAFFSWIAYETSVDRHEEILAFVREQRSLIRFIDLVTDKEAVRHAEELRDMRERLNQEEDQAVSGTDLDAALETAVA